MENSTTKCPMCERQLTAEDGYFVCAEHGIWYAYGAKLLVRAPREESSVVEPQLMPWEHTVPAI